MLHVYIDGYNATMSDADVAAYSKEEQREILATRVRTAQRRLFGQSKVAIVFDAREQFGVSSEPSGSITLLYAPDADTEIVNRCMRGGRNLLVVTNDRRLQARIAQDVGRHVRFASTDILFEQVGKRDSAPSAGASTKSAGQARSKKAPDAASKAAREVVFEDDIPRNARSITKELEALWLNEEEDS